MIFPDKSSEFYRAASRFAVKQVDANCQEVGAHIMAGIDAIVNEGDVVSLVLAARSLTPEKLQAYYSSPNVPLGAFEHSFVFVRDGLVQIASEVDPTIEPADFWVAPIGPEVF